MPATQSTSRPTSPQPPRPPQRARRKGPWIAALICLAVAAVGAGIGLVWFFRDDAPPAVSLERATAGLSSSTTEADTSTTGTDAPTTTAAGSSSPTAAGAPTTTPTTAAATAASAVAGTWAVDTSIGTFDYEEATGSFAGFRVAEELSGIGSTTAVGRTPEVSGTITIEGTTLTATSIEADLTALTTNDSRRDDRALGALDVDTYPTATFVLTQPIDLGEAASSGGPVAVTATGDLTIHGVTRSVQLPLEAQLTGTTIAVVGSLPITFADYDVELPSAPIVVSLDDNGTMEIQLLFTRQ